MLHILDPKFSGEYHSRDERIYNYNDDDIYYNSSSNNNNNNDIYNYYNISLEMTFGNRGTIFGITTDDGLDDLKIESWQEWEIFLVSRTSKLASEFA
jgi:esterase/lipase superfamily enzyme